MKIKKIGLITLALILLPIISYLIIAIILSSITVNKQGTNNTPYSTIFLSNNGIHADIILAKKDMTATLQKGLISNTNDKFLAFGWGEQQFYLNTVTINNMTPQIFARVMLINSPSVIHVQQYQHQQSDWIAVPVSKEQLAQINHYIQTSFQHDSIGNKLLFVNRGYGKSDNFYKANGKYSSLNTCNTWANTAFKNSGLQASLWTPFSQGLIFQYD